MYLRLFWPALCVACAPAPLRVPPHAAPTHISLPPVVVRGEPDPLTNLSAYDAPTLFHLAEEGRRANRLAVAVALYQRLLSEFPESELKSSAQFNLGLANEGLHDYARAIERYTELAGSAAPSDRDGRQTWIDAHFRMAVCWGELGNWWKAVAIFDRVLEQSFLEDFDRLEALVGRGIVLRQTGEVDAAEAALERALGFHHETAHAGVFDDRGLAAEAAFHLGEIAISRYAAVVLEWPLDVLRQRLATKCEHLLSAQGRYLRAIRYGDAHTVAAAGFRIGSLYENLYEDLVALAAPADLSAEEAEAYNDEVRRRLRVLVEKAIMAYERTLLVGKSAPSALDWVGRIEQALARLRAVFLAGEVLPPHA